MFSVSSDLIYEGQRIKKTTGGAATNFVGDLYEGRSNGRTTHIYAGGVRVASVVNRDVSYFHGDHLGSARLIADDLGNLVATASYKPFGEFAKQTGFVGQEGRFYTDQYRDNESGLYYYNARYYNPKIVHFMTADTIVPYPDNSQSFNRYAYVHNNPVNWIDPSGHIGMAVELMDDQLDQIGYANTLWGNYSWLTPNYDIEGQITSFDLHSVDFGEGGEKDYTGTMDSLNGIAVNEASLIDDLASWNLSGVELHPREPETIYTFGGGTGAVGLRSLSTAFGIIKLGYNIYKEGSGRSKFSVNNLSRSGRLIDSADKSGQLSRAGRALSKHGSSQGKRAASSAFPQARGNPAQINHQGQNVLDEILYNPNTQIKPGNRFGGIDVVAPNGRGARFDSGGTFRGFLEP